MPTNFSVELTKEELETLKSLCPKGSALQRSLQMATIAAPVPLSVKTWRAACNFADNYSTNSIKEPLSWVERLKSNAERLLHQWNGNELLYNTILANPAYPFAFSFDECEFNRWYELASDRITLLLFIKQLDESERRSIEQYLRDIPDELDLRQAISYACDQLEAAHMPDVPRAWRETTFKTTGDEEGWI